MTKTSTYNKTIVHFIGFQISRANNFRNASFEDYTNSGVPARMYEIRSPERSMTVLHSPEFSPGLL